MVRARSSKLSSLLRLTLALAIAMLVVARSDLLQAGANGRDHSRCVTACNSTQKSCKSQCRIDCVQLFPDNTETREACQDNCAATCMDARDDCKLVCQANKFPSSPEEP